MFDSKISLHKLQESFNIITERFWVPVSRMLQHQITSYLIKLLRQDCSLITTLLSSWFQMQQQRFRRDDDMSVLGSLLVYQLSACQQMKLRLEVLQVSLFTLSMIPLVLETEMKVKSKEEMIKQIGPSNNPGNKIPIFLISSMLEILRTRCFALYANRFGSGSTSSSGGTMPIDTLCQKLQYAMEKVGSEIQQATNLAVSIRHSDKKKTSKLHKKDSPSKPSKQSNEITELTNRLHIVLNKDITSILFLLRNSLIKFYTESNPNTPSFTNVDNTIAKGLVSQHGLPSIDMPLLLNTVQ